MPCVSHIPSIRCRRANALARACWPVPEAFHHLYLLTPGELVSLCEAAEKGRGIRPIRLLA
jgi:hypothetical protein